MYRPTHASANLHRDLLYSRAPHTQRRRTQMVSAEQLVIRASQVPTSRARTTTSSRRCVDLVYTTETTHTAARRSYGRGVGTVWYLSLISQWYDSVEDVTNSATSNNFVLHSLLPGTGTKSSRTSPNIGMMTTMATTTIIIKHSESANLRQDRRTRLNYNSALPL